MSAPSLLQTRAGSCECLPRPACQEPLPQQTKAILITGLFFQQRRTLPASQYRYHQTNCDGKQYSSFPYSEKKFCEEKAVVLLRCKLPLPCVYAERGFLQSSTWCTSTDKITFFSMNWGFTSLTMLGLTSIITTLEIRKVGSVQRIFLKACFFQWCEIVSSRDGRFLVRNTLIHQQKCGEP